MPETLRNLQQAWARHIRDPRQPLPAGIAPERMALYRALCIGNVDGVLDGSFPRLRQACGEERWQRTVERFYAEHRCATPLFPELGGEFLSWLLQADALAALPAWAAELAHFEWTQQRLLMTDEVCSANAATPTTSAALQSSPLVWSPLVRVCGYRWPVDRPLESSRATPPDQPTLLLLRRSSEHALQITQLTVFDYLLLQAIDREPRTAQEHVEAIACESGEPIAAVVAYGWKRLERLHADGVVNTAQVLATSNSSELFGGRKPSVLSAK